ncbi:putative ribonuclease H-like domain-containing protein [Tanacetum coccineum]|uniref:Ribonuclease H-like domain-containing protein n=1 Tax=Tanacetum coccineum TaxID=301880 RepID=A0ABQ4WBV7_9ASTR
MPPARLEPTTSSESSQVTPIVDIGKVVATDTLHHQRLLRHPKEVRADHNGPVLINWEVDGIIVQIPNDQLQEYVDKKERMDIAMKEAQQSEPVIKKIAAEIVSEANVKIKGTKDFIKHQDAHIKVLIRAHTEKLKQKAELRNKRNNDPRNFDVHKNFKFGDFSISEWDELSVNIPKKNNKVVSKLMTSLVNNYERLNQIPGELGLKLSFPLPKQNLSLPMRKRKAMELEHETYIIGLHCRKELPEGRVDDVHKVETETLMGYKVMASNVKTDANLRFYLPTAEETLARERERKARTTLLMALPEDHLAKFHKMTDAKEMWEAIKSRFEGLHKGYDRFQSLLSQLEIHGAGVSTEDANQKFLRSLPSAWSQVSLIMRTKPGVDSLSFDDLYNNLRVFESDVKGSTTSSSSTQNVAFVSENTSSTNDVSTAYGVSNSFGHNSQYEHPSSYSLLANQSSCPQLDHEDLEQLDEFSMRMKKFYKKTGRKLQFDAKEPVGFDKTKVECYSCHKTGHFARECRSKGNQDSRRRDAWNTRNKDKENGRRSGKQEDSKALVTLDGEGVDWTSHSKDKQENYALMACSISSNTETSDRDKAGLGQETHESMLELVVNEPKVVSQSKVWYDTPIIEEYESDSEDEHTVPTNAARKVNTVKPIVNNARPKTGFHKTLSPLKAFNRKETAVKPSAGLSTKSFTETKGIVDSGCSRHMTGNKAYLAEYQDFNGGPVAFGGSKGYITGKDTECLVLSPEFKLPDENQVLLRIPRQNNMYSFNLENIIPSRGLACLIAKAKIDESNKWHRRLGHVNFKNLNKLVKGNLVRGLLQRFFKMPTTLLLVKKESSTRPPVRPNQFSWVFFLRTKDETSGILKDFIRQIQNQLNQKVKTIRCDNGIEFKNRDFIEFCGSKGIKREYSNARTPQQNRVAERKNRTLIEAARTMLADSFLPNTFWAKAVSTACYVLNRVLVTKPQNKTPYELITGKGPTWLFGLDYLTDLMNYQPVRSENQANKHAGPKEANHNVGTEDNIDAGNFEIEAESAQAYFVLPIWSSYTSTVKSSKAKNAGEEPNKNPDLKTDKKLVDKEDQVFLDELERLKRQEQYANDAAEALRKEFAKDTEDLLLQAGAAKASSTNIVNTSSTPVSTASPYGGLSFTDTDQDDSEIPTLEDMYDHPTDGIFTNASYNDKGAVDDFTNLETIVNVSPIPTSRINSIHPSTLILGDPNSTVQTRSNVTKSSGAYAFVSYIQKQRRNNHKDIQDCLFACFLSQNEPKKISEALEDENLPYGKKAIGTKWVYRNKKDERGVVVRNKARIEAIRIFLAFASYMGFIVYQMNVKIAFLYGKIDEEVYVSQPSGFVDPKYPKKVYKVVKALYGLHQAPRAWYATLSTFLLKSGYRRGTIDKTFFIKKDKNDIMLVQVYVDDIIFGSTKRSWCDKFEALMKSRFQMSSMGELTFFLRLQCKTDSTQIETQKPLVKDEESYLGQSKDLTSKLLLRENLREKNLVTDQAKKLNTQATIRRKHKKKAKPVITHHIKKKNEKIKEKRAWSDERCNTIEAKICRKKSLKKIDSKGIVTKQGEELCQLLNLQSIKIPLFMKHADYTMDYIRLEETQEFSTDKEKVSTDKLKDSTDRSKVSTDKVKVSTDRPDEGTDDQTEGRSATPTTQTPTPTTFRDDETIAQVLIIISQNKEKLKEKEKGVELKDVEETEIPKPTSTRSLLTLKPLPKIDPKDKGKKKIEEEDESDTESDVNLKLKRI